MNAGRNLPSRAPARRAVRRGAVFVEALIVVSILLLGLMGLMYFRDVYLTKLRVHRLARAAVLVHGMAGCTNPETPRDWLGAGDLEGLTGGAADASSQRAADPNTTARVNAGDVSTEARTVVDGLPGVSEDGKGVLNPIAHSEVRGRAELRRERFLQEDETLFGTDLASRSHVSCGEELTYEEDFGEGLSRMKDAFGDLMKSFFSVKG